jgi:hypothetical protein
VERGNISRDDSKKRITKAQIVCKFSYRSKGTERLGSRIKLESAVATGLADETLNPRLACSAICRLTRSIKTTSFFDS